MKRILIVDDNPRNIQLIANILKDYGFEVEYALDGNEAFEISSYQKFDLILMDVTMPQLDGFETCRAIKKTELNSDTPLIFITARTEEENITKGFKAGGVDYVTKPFNRAELLARIETHITLKKSKDKLRELNIALEDDLKATSANLELTQKKLEYATEGLSKLDSAKNEFLQIISHEVRTPLNGIIGLLDVLEGMLDSKEEQEFFDLFNASCKRLEQFSLLALEISRLKTKGKDVLKLQETDLKEFIERNISIRSDKLNAKELVLSNYIQSHNVAIDPNYLGQTISIIWNNVISHSPSQGKVTITGERLEEVYQLTIEDEGPGLPESILKFGSTPFSSEKHIDGNPGLELYFCRLTIEAHGGTMVLRNTPKGARIELMLPNSK